MATEIAPSTPPPDGAEAPPVPATGLAAVADRLPAPFNRMVANFSQLVWMRQLGLILGLAAVIAIGVGMVLWSREVPYHVLYGGLPEADTAQIMDALQRHHIPYRLDPKNGELMVPTKEVHAARIRLAGDGLPKAPPSTGFELLDNQPPFGTSQFMENARYQRALEGELTRSIATLGGVKSARIHLALPRPSVFLRDREKPSASVVVQLTPGRRLDRHQVEAIVHLVASSVPQLETERVSVVDQDGELLTRKVDPQTGELELTSAQFDHVRRVENTYIKRIEAILVPIAGPDGVRAQVTVDMDFSSNEQTRETFNPDLPALRSEQTLEEQSKGLKEAGIPGALSNQPPAAGTVPEKLNNGGAPPAAGEGVLSQGKGGDGPQTSVKRQSTRNYELDRTVSHSRGQMGQIRRVSAAVVVDDIIRPGADGATRLPRSPEEMERIKALVREAVGFDAQRGDAVSVVNASFAQSFSAETVPGPVWREPWFIELAKQGIAALVLLFLVLGVLRPAMRRLAGEDEKSADEDDDEGEEGEEGRGRLAGERGDGTRELRPMAEGEEGGLAGLAEDQLTLTSDLAGGAAQLEGPKVNEYEVLLDRVRTIVREDPKMVSQLVKNWISADV